MPKKKDRVITLRISENDFNIVESFAKAKGLSVSAYINSVIKSQTEYFIPLASTTKVSIPKEVLNSLYSYASKDDLDDLVSKWAIELEHVARLLWGELNLQTSLDVISKIAKYLMGTDARVITTDNFKKDSSFNEIEKEGTTLNYTDKLSGIGKNTSNPFWIIIRHNLGTNYSYFWNKMFIQFLGNLKNSVDFATKYDDTTISIRLKVK
jgi:hypothetical protein